MGVKQAGYPARDYLNYRPAIAVRLYEGNMIFKDTGFDEFGRPNPDWEMENPMHIGQYVVLHEDSNPYDIIVQPAEKASEAIGKIITNSKLRDGMGWTDDEQNILPRENREWGNFLPRGATVEFFGEAIDELKVVEGNDAISAGDYLDSTANEEFEVSDSATRWIALGKIEALKAGYVPALDVGYK